MRKLTKILRSAIAVTCCLCGMSVFAQGQMKALVANGGTTSDAISCAIGETFVGENVGMWDNAIPLYSGVHSVYDDGDVAVENLSDGALNIQLSDKLLAKGASYAIYNMAGIVLDRNEINECPYLLKYDNLLSGQCIIVVVNVANNAVANFKIFK